VSRPGQIRFLSYTAPLYDAVVVFMGFRQVWRALVERAAPAPGERCLDVCTGTGGVALALARRGTRVVGSDLAGGMLERAHDKARAAGLGERVDWVQMDARRLGFPDSCFPLVTCAMALHEMSEAERTKVLRELRRVASDRVLVADYRVPSRGWRRLLFRLVRAFEYVESDDFESFATRDLGERLAAAGLGVEAPWDAGPFRVWPCRVSRR
jgi:ubiquinone/menaquinone biosynthesis C-methylase UbiE